MAKKAISHSNTKLRAMLKGAGVRGPISKMNRAALLKAAKQHNLDLASNKITSGAAPSTEPQGSDVAMQASDGDGASTSVTAGAAPAIAPQGEGGISLAPVKPSTAKPLEIQGGGTQHKVTGFRDFVKKHGKEYKGDMKAMSKAWREQKGSGKAHDKFMKATEDYCEQSSGKGTSERDVAADQMNGDGRNKGDDEAYEQSQMQLGMGDSDDPQVKIEEQAGGTKRKREDEDDAEIRQAEAHVAFDRSAVQANAADAAAAAGDLHDAQETLATLRRDATIDSFVEDPYRMRTAADEPDDPGEDLRDSLEEAAAEDFHFTSIRDSAANVDLYSQQYEEARDDLLAARQRLAQAQSRLADLQRARAAQDADEDAADRQPEAASQMNAEPRDVGYYLDERYIDSSSDDEDLLSDPFPFEGSGHDISKYLEGGSFWKDAAEFAGSALTTAAPALMTAPIPGGRLAGLAALGVGAAATGASTVMD